MATTQQANEFRDALETISTTDRDKLFRKRFDNQPIFRLQEEYDAAVRFARGIEPIVDTLPENMVGDQLYSALNLLRDRVVNLAGLNDDSYYNQAADRAEDLRKAIQHLFQSFLSAAAFRIVDSGILDRQLVEEEEALRLLRVGADQILRETDAKLTLAGNRAVEAAKEAAEVGWASSVASDFKAETSHHNSRSFWWGAATSVLLAALLLYVSHLLKGPPSSTDITHWWQALYLLTLRLTALGVLAAAAGFALKACRAHIHMAETSRHRWKLSKNIPNFLLSASAGDARDEVLRDLIHAVAAFGSSGLLGGGEESILPTRQVIEQVSKFQPGSGGG